MLREAFENCNRTIPARRDIYREGESPHVLAVVLDGWVQCHKQLANGRRQILSFLLPGDLCTAASFMADPIDHTVAAVTQARIAEIAEMELARLVPQCPSIAQAVSRNGQIAAAIQRERTTSVGQRTAYERIAHLFCEMFFRLRVIGLTEGHSCPFPLTQSEIAEVTGLTQVHVNRTLQDLRREGLVELQQRQLTLIELDRLMSIALFNPNYLGLDRDGRELGLG